MRDQEVSNHLRKVRKSYRIIELIQLFPVAFRIKWDVSLFNLSYRFLGKRDCRVASLLAMTEKEKARKDRGMRRVG